MDPHRLAELRSIAYHRAVADRLRQDPDVLSRARARVERWLENAEVHEEYARAWLELLERPVESLCDELVRDDERMRTLRTATPFAGVVDPRTRWRIWREVREASDEAR